jgi:hypothetical protein
MDFSGLLVSEKGYPIPAFAGLNRKYIMPDAWLSDAPPLIASERSTDSN